MTVKIEKRAVRAPIKLYTTTANVKVWFDDVSLMRIGD